MKDDKLSNTRRCPTCLCEDFLEIRSEVEPGRPVNILMCEDCGAQYRTARATWLDLPILDGTARESMLIRLTPNE